MMRPIRKIARFALRRGEFSSFVNGRKIRHHLPRFNDNFESLELLRKNNVQDKIREV